MDNTSNNTGNNANRSEEVGALWKRVSKNGMTYLAGHLKYENLPTDGSAKVVVFSNDNKVNDKQPDYRMYLSKMQQSPQSSEREVVGASSTSEVEPAEDLL